MEDQQYIRELVAKARAAQAVYNGFDQARVDAVTKAVGKIVADNALALSTEAVEETHFGVVESKIGKHTRVLAEHWDYMKGKPSVGLLEDDPVNKVKTFAKPMGVVCCITPSTNPTSTAAANTMCALKGRNAVIVAPHPGAKKCTMHAVALMRSALKQLGAPEDLVQTVETPSIAKTQILMGECDVIVATGGPGMVKSAFSSGTPAMGVGQGNMQVIIDRGCKSDLDTMAGIIVNSRNYDFGTSCSGEQMLHIPREMLDDVVAACVRQGAYLIEDDDTIEKIRQQTFVDDTINRDIVGKMPHELGSILGISQVPEGAKVLMFKVFASGDEDVMCREIMCPMLRFNVYDAFEEAVEHAKRNLEVEGAGHTSVVWSDNDEHISYAASQLPVSRLLISQRGNNSSGNTHKNGLVPTMSLGCGSWGGTSTTDNINYLNLINKMRVSYAIDTEEIPLEELWAD